MDPLNRISGGHTQLIAASGTTAIETGYQCYAIKPRIDNTQITSVTKIENDNAASGVLTDLTWMNQNLLAGPDYITLEDPIISITMASGTPSVLCYCEKRNTNS